MIGINLFAVYCLPRDCSEGSAIDSIIKVLVERCLNICIFSKNTVVELPDLGDSLRSDGDLGHSLLVFRYSGSETARTFLLLYKRSFAAQAKQDEENTKM
jgi:hypothetical protein